MSVELRFPTREEYHQFYQQYDADPIMDPRPYCYQKYHVDRSYDYDVARRAVYPTYGIFADGRIVGMLSLKRIEVDKSRCEIGLIMMNDACKDHGYGTAAMRLGMMEATDKYHVKSIFADTTGSNTRMQHILEKLGFQMIERVPKLVDMLDHKEDWLNYVWEEQK